MKITARALSVIVGVLALSIWAEPISSQTGVLNVINDKAGVGTANPAQLLHVVGDTGPGGNGLAQVFVQDASTATGGRVLFKLENNGIVRFDLKDTASGQGWRFANQGSFNITNTSTGVVSFRHAQNGDLTITGDLFTAAGPVPDYVFEADYSLMPLSELKAFVEREKHLPNVPTADEVASRGKINLSDLQLTLLEKIEELTLYTLAQEEALESLVERNRLLAVRLEALEQ